MTPGSAWSASVAVTYSRMTQDGPVRFSNKMTYTFALCGTPQDLQSTLSLAEVAAHFPQSCVTGMMRFDTASMRASYTSLLHSGSLQRGVVQVTLVCPKAPCAISFIDLPGKCYWPIKKTYFNLHTERNQHWASSDDQEDLASDYAKNSDTVICVLCPPTGERSTR